MQETFESLTLNNSVLSINNHPTILSLKEIGSLEWDLVRSPIYTSKYELSILESVFDNLKIDKKIRPEDLKIKTGRPRKI